MNILLIGNGFDLAHGLPTKYTDFLEFIRVIKEVFDLFKTNADKTIEWGKLHPEIQRQIQNNMGDIRNNIFSQEEMWNDLIGDNFWVDYFEDNPIYKKENWIDFESEISQVIQSLDNDMQTLGGERFDLDDIIFGLSNETLSEIYSKYVDAVQSINPVITDEDSAKGITYREIRDKLLTDLNKLIRAFEIYLTEYVEKIDIKVISPDMRDIAKEYIAEIEQMMYNKVISFNYTNIYEQIYLKDYESDMGEITDYTCREIVIDYIHGKANIDNTIDSNNMILGIDEYLKKKKRNEQVEFIAFKKYYQRIHKGTGCKYKEWLDEIDEDFNDGLKTDEHYLKWVLTQQWNHLYIFGHSLDVTDKDILRELILTQGMFTTIYYRNLDQKGQQIANLVKVIGQDDLIKRTGGGGTRTIEFRLQQPMESVK